MIYLYTGFSEAANLMWTNPKLELKISIHLGPKSQNGDYCQLITIFGYLLCLILYFVEYKVYRQGSTTSWTDRYSQPRV